MLFFHNSALVMLNRASYSGLCDERSAQWSAQLMEVQFYHLFHINSSLISNLIEKSINYIISKY